MITIKAFRKDEKGIYCQPGNEKFYYEIGKEYEMPVEEVKMCSTGFHAAADCDINNTLMYYYLEQDVVYGLVDINVVEKEGAKVVGNKIKVLKILSLDECIEYDKIGRWCYRYAEANQKDKTIVKRMQEEVIKKDETGYYCYLFASNVKGADIERLQEAVIKKDDDGLYCYIFAINVKGADKKKLLKIAKEKGYE